MLIVVADDVPLTQIFDAIAIVCLSNIEGALFNL
jgi:hypothetical protein